MPNEKISVKCHFLDEVKEARLSAIDALNLVATIGSKKMLVIELFAPNLTLFKNGYVKEDSHVEINMLTTTAYIDKTYHIYVMVDKIIGTINGKTYTCDNIAQNMRSIKATHMRVCDYIRDTSKCDTTKDYYDRYSSGLPYIIPRPAVVLFGISMCSNLRKVTSALLTKTLWYKSKFVMLFAR